MTNSISWADFGSAYLGKTDSGSLVFDYDNCTYITKSVAFGNDDAVNQIADLQEYADHFDAFLADNPNIDGNPVIIVERDSPDFFIQSE